MNFDNVRGSATKCPSDVDKVWFLIGKAMVTTSIILILGFLVLTLSTFQVNVTFGLLSAITIGLALIADFLFLPPLLMWLVEKKA